MLFFVYKMIQQLYGPICVWLSYYSESEIFKPYFMGVTAMVDIFTKEKFNLLISVKVMYNYLPNLPIMYSGNLHFLR